MKIHLSITLLLIIGSRAFAQNSEYICHYLASEQQAKDSMPAYMLFDETSLLYYALGNTDDQVYIVLATDDILLQKKILNFGINHYIKSPADTGKSYFIQYPIDHQNEMDPEQSMANIETGQVASLEDQAFNASMEWLIDGFGYGEELIGTGERGFHGGIVYDKNGRLWVALQIDLKNLIHDTTLPIHITFQPGYMGLQKKQELEASIRKNPRSGKKRSANKRTVNTLTTSPSLTLDRIMLSNN